MPKSQGDPRGEILFLSTRLTAVRETAGGKRHTPELSHSEKTKSPRERETAEDQDSFCRSHVKVDEQFKQRARCEVNVHEWVKSRRGGDRLQRPIKEEKDYDNFTNQDCKERDRAIIKQIIIPRPRRISPSKHAYSV